jgi:hypothetical protein
MKGMFESTNIPKGAHKQSVNFKLIHFTLKLGSLQRERKEESRLLNTTFFRHITKKQGAIEWKLNFQSMEVRIC